MWNTRVCIGMYMAVDKGIGFHVWAKFFVYIKAAWKHRYKQLGRHHFSCNLIKNINGCTDQVYLHFVTGFMLDTHRRLGDTISLTILSLNCVLMYVFLPSTLASRQYSVQRSVRVTPFLASSL